MVAVGACSFYLSAVLAGAGGATIGFVWELEMEGLVGLRGGKDMTVAGVVGLFSLGFDKGEIGGLIGYWTGVEIVGLKMVYLGWTLLVSWLEGLLNIELDGSPKPYFGCKFVLKILAGFVGVVISGLIVLAMLLPTSLRLLNEGVLWSVFFCYFEFGSSTLGLDSFLKVLFVGFTSSLSFSKGSYTLVYFGGVTLVTGIAGGGVVLLREIKSSLSLLISILLR